MKAELRRKLYVGAGHLCLALGVAGLFLPVMPTVVFMLGAAWCYARGSPALRKKLLEHPKFGPPIRDWEEKRQISLKGKVSGIVMVTLGMGASVVFLLDALWLRVVMGVTWAAIVVFLLAVKTKR